MIHVKKLKISNQSTVISQSVNHISATNEKDI